MAPWDQHVGLSDARLTPAAERLTTLAGAVGDSFEKGMELLAEMAGITLSESSVQRVTEATGQRIATTLGQGHIFGPAHPWRWYCDALGRRVAYIGLDATGVRQQGPHGEKADGRMAQVGVIFNPPPDQKRGGVRPPKPGTTPMQARYLSGLYPLADMGPLLRRQGGQVGMDEADIWVALTDGGAGLEAFIKSNFPRVEAVILDFWHAAQYLAKLAGALHPKDEAKAAEQTAAWCRILKEEGGHAMLGVLQAEVWPRLPGLSAVRAEVLTYFENQKERMDYPSYEANGWYIGSGVVESACKTVVGQRLKNAGMRWREAGSHALCHVRALYRSERGQWQAFWQRNLTP